MANEQTTSWRPEPALPPPAGRTGALGWVRASLFSSPFNATLTLVTIYLVYRTGLPAAHWLFIDAHWMGHNRADCAGQGACWVFVKMRLGQFLYGFYPEGQRWRVSTAFGLFALLVALLALPRVPAKRWTALTLLVLYPPTAFLLLRGGGVGLAPVRTSLWGGLTLTLVIAVLGIAVSLPLGTLLALGRRSRMPVIRALCATFIELWRGVPLITVLFMASVMLPLFLPEGLSVNKLLRALIGITLFESAYMAEVVRGGLQAIPRGQYEASVALGLGPWRSLGLVVLPQALKLVIPGIVNTFIALFKDTTLVLIIGLFDLLGMVQAALTDPNWLGYAAEGYVFAGFGYWLFCFGMSRYSQRLERRLHRGREPL